MVRVWSKIRGIQTAAAKVRNRVNTAWLRRLFPHTGPPDEFERRLQRIHTVPIEVDGRQGGAVICRFIYPEIDDTIQSGTVKFYLPPELSEHSGRRLPLLHMAGYEIDDAEAIDYLKEGLVVSTIHAHPLNPLSRGPKLEWALMHAMRRLPFVDDAQVMVKGNSSGGNMALSSAAETFPLCCAMSMFPNINIPYILSYVIKSKALDDSHRPGSGKPRLPILYSVAAVPEQAAEYFGADPEAPAYFELSPVRWLEKITAPVLVVFSTGDMLMPIDQVDLKLVKSFNAAKFPPGYTRDMSKLLTRPEQRVRLLDALPADEHEVFTVPIPKNTRKKKAGGRDLIGTPLQVPFSRLRQWSIAVIDDGAPEPRYGHFKYYIAPDFAPFRRWALYQGVQEAQLTQGKLVWLMKRYLGLQPLDFMVTPSRRPAHKCQLLDFPLAERSDVLRSLITFARSDEAARRLADLYATLPPDLKGLGQTLGSDSVESVRRALKQASAANEPCHSLGLGRLKRYWTSPATM